MSTLFGASVLPGPDSNLPDLKLLSRNKKCGNYTQNSDELRCRILGCRINVMKLLTQMIRITHAMALSWRYGHDRLRGIAYIATHTLRKWTVNEQTLARFERKP